MSERKKEQRFHNGIPVDSEEEVMMLLWLEELIENQYCESVKRSDTFLLSEPLINSYEETIVLATKTKIVPKKQLLLSAHRYTPEFAVIWLNKGKELFVDSIFKGKFSKQFYSANNLCTYLEIKSDFDYNNMTRLFIINQKWMWKQYGIYVNLVHPSKLFEETFTPQAYLTTKTGKQRVIHWKIKTLEEYVREQSGS